MCIETIYNDTIFQTSITIPKPYKGSRYVFSPDRANMAPA